MKKFALIGAAGFIAPKHMKAIKETGNDLVVAMDKFDSVGIMDHYFPSADFFTEFERFDRHIEKLRREKNGIDFLTVCTPNHLHDSHIRFGLRSHASVICEKPLVLNPWNLEALIDVERESGQKVYTILQLRHHPELIKLKNKIQQADSNHIWQIDLKYITVRGKWYQRSWKGNLDKSGGIATNIGIHFFDMLIWIFGDVVETFVEFQKNDKAAGRISFKNAQVNWLVSIDENDLPLNERIEGRFSYRSLNVDGENIYFNNGFTDLHTESYKAILSQNGFGLNDVRKTIQLVHDIRNQHPKI